MAGSVSCREEKEEEEAGEAPDGICARKKQLAAIAASKRMLSRGLKSGLTLLGGPL